MLDFPAAPVAVPEPLIVTVHRDGPGTLLRAAGEIDLLTVAELQRPLTEALTAGGDVELDLTAIDFIDSTGLRLLLEARNRAERTPGTALTLRIDPDGHVRRLLDLTGVLELFQLAA